MAGKVVVLKTMVWNRLGYLRPDGTQRKDGYVAKSGLGHEEWNGDPDSMGKGYRVFHTETTDRPKDWADGSPAIITTTYKDGGAHALGVAAGVLLNTDDDKVGRIQDLQRTPQIPLKGYGGAMVVQRRRLTVVGRTITELRRRDGWSIRLIARELGRSSGTLCDEIRRHGDAAGYRAATAEADAAASRRRSGRKPRLARDGLLFAEIARLLRLGWSPEQISGRRKRIENGMEQPFGLRVSHEAIYTAPYALPRGELLSYLRQAKPCGAASRRVPNGPENSWA